MYYLMNKDQKLLSFCVEKKIGSEICVQKKSYTDLRPKGFLDINDWIGQRNYAKQKDHLQKWLTAWHMDTVQGFIDVTHCLGLNDTLWVKAEDSDLTWDTVNLYENEFSDVVEHTAFDKGLQGLKLQTTSPEFTSEGTFAKCWKRRNGTIDLIKKGSEGFANAGLEPYSEYYASQIAGKLTRDTIPYDLEMFKGSLCTSCQIFTDVHTGYMPFYRILTDTRQQSIASVLGICEEMGYGYEFRRMIFIDSIIMNQDRHLGNFGFLIDNDTFEIKGFAPLFDFNMSLMCRAMDSDLSIQDPLKYIHDYDIEHKLGGKFEDVGKEILTPDMKKKLPAYDKIHLQPHEKYNLPAERFGILNNALEQTYDMVRGRVQMPVIGFEPEL